MRHAALSLFALLATLSASAQDLTWTWSPEPRWLVGVDVNLRFFDEGLDFGSHFAYTTVADADVPPVLVVFDRTEPSAARVFDYRGGLRDLGVGTFPGAAYDVSDPDHPRRLNVGIWEDRNETTPDGTWHPTETATGGHEYLMIFASDYDATGATYAGESGYSLDTYYGLAPRIAPGQTFLPRRTEFRLTPAPLRDVVATAVANGSAEVRWTAATYVGADALRVVDDATGEVLASVSPGSGAVTLDGLDEDRSYRLRVDLADGETTVSSRTVEVRPLVSRGVVAASQLDPGRAGTSTYGDVWGYVGTDGTEYALLAGRGTGLSVIDVSGAPAGPPVEVGFLASPPGTSDAKDVKVYGHHAYVVHEVGPVQIVDLTDPANPTQVGLLDVQPGVANGGSHNVLVAEGKLWVVGGRTSGDAGVRVYSLDDPTDPAFLGEFKPTHQPVPYYHDFEVHGDRAYGSAIYAGGGVDVLDVSDPAAIRLVATFTYPGAGAHNTCATEDGQTVYVGDEIGSSGNWMRIFDVSDPADAELVGEIIVDRQAAVHNCYVLGQRLYVAHYTEGFRVFDVSDPHAPVEIGVYDTFRQPGYGYRGAWTATPFLPSGKVLVSDMQSGLFVVSLEAALPTQPSPAPSAPLSAWPNPTAGAATLSYTLLAPAEVRLTLVDVRGREVAVVDAGSRDAGTHRAALPTERLPAGVYVARLVLDGSAQTTLPVTVVR